MPKQRHLPDFVDPKSPDIPIPEVFFTTTHANPSAPEAEQYFQRLFTFCRDEDVSQASIYTEKLIYN